MSSREKNNKIFVNLKFCELDKRHLLYLKEKKMANLCTSLVTQKDYEVFVRSRVKYLRRGDLQFNRSSNGPKSKLLFSAILTFLFLPELQAIKKPTIKHLFWCLMHLITSVAF